MNCYPAYKDSGIQWLGEIPKHWTVKRLRHISPFLTVGVVVNPSSYVTDYGEPFLFGSDVTEQGINITKSRRVPKEISDGELRKTRLEAGDLVTVRVGYPGVTAVVPPELEGANCAAIMLIRKSHTFDSFWLCYAMNSRVGRYQVEQVQYGAAQEQLNINHAIDFAFPVPPLHEQRKIATYLDHKTAELGILVTAKQHLLNLLAEKRRALITHAVTRGLNADTPLCDSGIDWLGMFPEHWEMGRLKWICKSLQTGPFGSQLHAEDYIDRRDGGIPVINPAHLTNGRIVPDDRVTVNEIMAEYLAAHRLEVGDVVLSRRGEIGRCGLVTEKEVGWLCGSGSLRVRPDGKILDSKYLVLLLTNTFAGSWLSLMSVGTTMDNLNTEIVGELAITLPPLQEQQAIVTYVENQASKLDKLEAATKYTIKLLQERRTALISSVVTGQIHVGESYAT